MKRSFWVSVPVLLVGSSLAEAQPATTAQPPVGTPTEAAPANDTPGTEAEEKAAAPHGTPSGPDETLQIDDPMLAPVPPPERVLKDWREALEIVRTRSSSYIQAQAQVEAARGRSRMALAGALPTLRGTAQVNKHLITKESFNPATGQSITFPAPTESWGLGANLRVPVIAVRNWYDYSTSKGVIEQAEMSRDDAERMIIGGLAEAMVTVVTAERLAEVTRVSLAAALSTLDLNRRRARLGAGSAVDVLRSKQEVARSRAQVVERDEGLRQAREALGQALGYAEPVGITPNLHMDQLRKDARDTCSAGTDPTDRADVRAALAGAAVAERNVKSVMYSHVPTVDFLSNVAHTSGNSPFAPNTTWTIGGVLTWHLYDGGQRYGEKRLNEALYAQAQETARQTARLATIQAMQATRGVAVAKASLEIAEESRTIAKDNAKLARAKFINGSGTSFDMVDTQSTARETELDVAVKEFELLRAEIIAFLALASCEL